MQERQTGAFLSTLIQLNGKCFTLCGGKTCSSLHCRAVVCLEPLRAAAINQALLSIAWS